MAHRCVDVPATKAHGRRREESAGRDRTHVAFAAPLLQPTHERLGVSRLPRDAKISACCDRSTVRSPTSSVSSSSGATALQVDPGEMRAIGYRSADAVVDAITAIGSGPVLSRASDTAERRARQTPSTPARRIRRVRTAAEWSGTASA